MECLGALPRTLAPDIHGGRPRESERVGARIIVEYQQISVRSFDEAGTAQISEADPGGCVDDDLGRGTPARPQVKLARDGTMLLVSTSIGSLQEEDACVQKHLEVFDTHVIHALHGGRVDGVLGPRLRGEVREKLDLAQGRGYGDAARCDLTGLVRVDAAAMLNVIDTRFNERSMTR